MIPSLAPYEKRFIAERLKIYKLPYAEVYDEVYDHILLACEQMRKQGDSRPILLLFQQTITEDFDGHVGFGILLKDRRQAVRWAIRQNYKHYFQMIFGGWRLLLLFITALLIFSLTKILDLHLSQLFVTLVLFSLLPIVFWFVIGTKKGFFRTITSKRKKSLVNEEMFELLKAPIIGINIVIFGIFGLFDFIRGADSMYESMRSFIQYIGAPGLCFLIAISIHVSWVFMKVLENGYNRLIKQVI